MNVEKFVNRLRNRIFLVNRDFQMRWAKAAVLVGVLSTLLTGALILYPLFVFKMVRAPLFVPLPFILAMIAATLLNVGLISYFTIVVTNKVAGPMYRLMRSFRFVEEGFWGPVMQVRDDDEMRYVVRGYNSMIQALVHGAEADLEQVRGARELVQLCRLREQANGELDKVSSRLLELEERYAGRLTKQPFMN